ncbi:4-alpha-glucanotransferase [Tropicimonas sp. IMCC6043]|uniref:4-alpha-glucanotransferase n=1 Tax=Tropicimonas sp. IMCC6043 TaxID=2510645 RepID=UPI00101B7528|nr:4-alpha-glucanotransferase [Tropicimonas sp. IMCC6043]RYH11161.1 4-alpha-glucanotransferase [Tropicimonas sp. IMCC6043]
MTGALRELAHLAGIFDDYWDQKGTRRATGAETDRALLRAMGFAVDDDAQTEASLARFKAERESRALPRWLILEPDETARAELAADAEMIRLDREDGSSIRLPTGPDPALPPGSTIEIPPLPVGIHVLSVDGVETTLLVAPARLPLPDPGWGVTLPLYGLRTEAEGGLGDYADLKLAVTALGGAGASFVGMNPVHAGFPTDSAAFSPYSPSHRRRLSTMHIAVGPDRPVNRGRLIDYAGILPAHRAALERAFEAFEAAGGGAAFDAWVATEGGSLERFATHQALADLHGPYWLTWETGLQNAHKADAIAFREANPAAIRFHCWLQWTAEQQLAEVSEAANEAGMRFGLYLDLAVGTHPHGAETWSDGSVFAKGVSLGAPPDAFSAEGQCWALAPFNPYALAAMHFRPLAETLRRQMRFAKLLRIDHVLGFERAFWVPTDSDAPGTYVVMPREAMLAVVRIEAARAGATVIGEDLGNVPDGLQEAMARSGLLGCRLVMFEQPHHAEFRQPEDYSETALASFGSHDVPTWAGWRAGSDVTLRHELGELDAPAYADAMSWRADEVAAFDALAGTDGPDPDGMHRFLGRVASRLVALQIEDILGVEEQANLPGTVDSYPNWRRRLPVGAAGLAGHPAVARAADIMKDTGRQE